MDTYKSIATPSEGLYKDRGSRFLSFAYPCDDPERAKELVSQLKKEYHDARHHCFAYRIGLNGDIWRSSDDGEPSGTAGRQILGQIDSDSLSDILVVVVRYFGGIKLGVPGLIAAYKGAAADALGAASIIEKVASKTFTLHFDYLEMNSIMRIVKDLSLKVLSQEFSQECRLKVRVRLDDIEPFRERVGEGKIE